MDDLQLVRELGHDTALPHPDQLAPARARLLAAIPAPTAAARGPAAPERAWTTTGPTRRDRSRWRPAWVGAATAGLAAALVAVLVLAPDQIGGDVPAANAEAAEILNNAAAAARREPFVTPRPDQFLYVRQQAGPSGIQEVWYSMDGTRDGLVRQSEGGRIATTPLPGCRNGRAAVVKGDRPIPNATEPCVPNPAYLPDLPKDKDAMRAYLIENGTGEPGDANSMGKSIFFLLNSHYLHPRSRAAVFEAAAELPGLKVVKDIKDSAGRPGIGIGWENDRTSIVIIFDTRTYAVLDLAPWNSAVLKVAIVDKVGQTS